MKLIPTIGLEIHAELMTNKKVFCECEAKFGGEPSSRCCPVCMGLPGTLPVLNPQAVELAVRAGYALGCEVANFAKWDRKNYFYPDLPKAYQISQLPRPLCLSGKVKLESGVSVRINHIHLEEDAGKLIHEDDARGAFKLSDAEVDFNRCGIPLIEIVTEPDLHSAEDVEAFVSKVRQLLVYAGCSDGKMEQGSLRADVNISLASEEDTAAGKLGTRSEIKNVNSISGMVAAVAFEIERQTERLEKGLAVEQETRRWNAAIGESVLLRTKEDAHDYRYFPDPDIPDVRITDAQLRHIKDTMPELPDARRLRYTTELSLSEKDADALLREPAVSNFFDAAVKSYNNPKKIANYILTELLRRANAGEISLNNITLNPSDFARLVELVETGKLSQGNQKDVLREMLETGGAPDKICEEKGLFIKEDLGIVESTIDKILSDNPAAVQQYRGGEMKVFAFLMGQANRQLKGSATPAVIKKILEEKLNG